MTALLPQFVDAKRSAYLQLAIIVITTIIVDLLVLFGYALFARSGARSLRSAQVKAWSERVFAIALVFFGARLLLSRK